MPLPALALTRAPAASRAAPRLCSPQRPLSITPAPRRTRHPSPTRHRPCTPPPARAPRRLYTPCLRSARPALQPRARACLRPRAPHASAPQNGGLNHHRPVISATRPPAATAGLPRGRCCPAAADAGGLLLRPLAGGGGMLTARRTGGAHTPMWRHIGGRLGTPAGLCWVPVPSPQAGGLTNSARASCSARGASRVLHSGGRRGAARCRLSRRRPPAAHAGRRGTQSSRRPHNY